MRAFIFTSLPRNSDLQIPIFNRSKRWIAFPHYARHFHKNVRKNPMIFRQISSILRINGGEIFQ
jgi:hypothetical protein